MANPNAIKFCRDLFSAFSRWPIAPETKDLYQRKLSAWKPTKQEWDNVLDALIQKFPEAELPGLQVIYDEIKRAQRQGPSQALGWMYFRLNDIDYAVRLISLHGEWVYAPVEITDASGRKIQLQKNPWKTPQAPEGAINVMYVADRPVNEPYEELPVYARSNESHDLEPITDQDLPF